MEFRKISPAREFPVGNGDIVISHCANLILDTDEQVTFLTGDGKEYDVVRKPWGYYATPSLNGRLKRNGLRAGLTRSIQSGLFFVVLVDEGHSEECQNTALTKAKNSLPGSIPTISSGLGILSRCTWFSTSDESQSARTSYFYASFLNK